MKQGREESEAQDLPIQEEKPLSPALDYRGLRRSTPLPTCRVSLADLKRLYNDLDKKAQDAIELQLSTLERPADQDLETFERFKNEARRLGHVTVSVNGSRGEEIVSTSVEALDEAALPDVITSVHFDSAAALQSQNANPANRFRVQLDFTEPPGFNVYNPWDQPTPNSSRVEVSGPAETWVTGVYESVLSFFTHRQTQRSWLHSNVTFTLLNWALGFPIALWLVFRLDQVLSPQLAQTHTALKGALYVYVFLLALVAFRISVWVARWLFPVIELEGARSRSVRRVMGVILLGVLSGLIYDVIRTLFG